MEIWKARSYEFRTQTVRGIRSRLHEADTEADTGTE